MKKFTILILLLFLFAICNSQQIYINDTIFPYSGSNCLRSILEMDSTYYVLSGNVDTPYIWFQTNFILNINKSGNIINKKVWWDSLHSYSNTLNNSFIKTPEQNLVYIGAIKDTQNIISGYLVKLNKNFDTLWTRTFAHPDTLIASQTGANVYNVLTAIKQTYDGGYIITGNYNKDCIAGNVRSYLLKTDSLGNMEWINLYNNVESLFDIEMASDSGFFFPTSINGQLYAVKTDNLGNILWNIKVNTNSNPSFPMDLEIVNQNYLIVSSAYWYDLTYNLRGLTISKVNTITHNKVWEKNYFLYQNFKSEPLHQSMGLDILSDGNIIVSGTSIVVNPLDSNENGYKGVLMKLNQNGDSLWARYYGYGDFKDICQFNDIALTDDGGFLCVGWHIHLQTGISWQNAWLVKLDSMGCDTPGCHTVGIDISTPLNVRDIIVFPNPASNEITIDFGETLEQDGFVEIYNITGMLVSRRTRFTSNENSNKVKIDVSHLKTGLYLGKIIFNTGEVGSFKFVVE